MSEAQQGNRQVQAAKGAHKHQEAQMSSAEDGHEKVNTEDAENQRQRCHVSKIPQWRWQIKMCKLHDQKSEAQL